MGVAEDFGLASANSTFDFGLGLASTAFGADLANKAQKRTMRRQLWMASEMPSYQMKGLLKAGINPIMMVRGGGLGGGGGGLSTPSVSPGRGPGDRLGSAVASSKAIYEKKLMNQQISESEARELEAINRAELLRNQAEEARARSRRIHFATLTDFIGVAGAIEAQKAAAKRDRSQAERTDAETNVYGDEWVQEARRWQIMMGPLSQAIPGVGMTSRAVGAAGKLISAAPKAGRAFKAWNAARTARRASGATRRKVSDAEAMLQRLERFKGKGGARGRGKLGKLSEKLKGKSRGSRRRR